MDDVLISKAAAIDALKRAAYWQDAERKIAELPAVDAAPVVHGYWINHIDDLFPEDSMIECSECHEYTHLLPDDNYCPNCGAKMDGRETDE